MKTIEKKSSNVIASFIFCNIKKIFSLFSVLLILIGLGINTYAINIQWTNTTVADNTEGAVTDYTLIATMPAAPPSQVFAGATMTITFPPFTDATFFTSGTIDGGDGFGPQTIVPIPPITATSIVFLLPVDADLLKSNTLTIVLNGIKNTIAGTYTNLTMLADPNQGGSTNDFINSDYTIVALPPTLDWEIIGNDNIEFNNFIGTRTTSPFKDFVIKTDDVERARITGEPIPEIGNMGIGDFSLSPPKEKLHVDGFIRSNPLISLTSGLVVADLNGTLNSKIDFTGSINDVLLGDGTFGISPAVSDNDWTVDFINNWTFLTNTTHNLGVGTTTPTATTEILHSDINDGAFALRITNEGTGAPTDYTQAGIAFNVSVDGNPNFYASRIYSQFDGDWVGDNRFTISILDGGFEFFDVFNVTGTRRVGINTISPTQTLDVIGTTRTTNFQMTNGAASDFILTSMDADGNATWTDPATIPGITDDQILTFVSPNLSIEDGNTVDLSSLINDADADPTNEFNTNLSLIGNNLSITDAGGTLNVNLTPLVDDGDWTVDLPNNRTFLTNTAHNLGIGTTNPTAKTEILHTDFTQGANVLRLTNQGDGVNYTETGIAFNVGLDTNANYYATRIYSIYDSQSAYDGRISMQVRDGFANLQDVLNIKNEAVGINTISPNEALDVIGTTRTTNFQMTNGAASDFILTSVDADGNAIWTDPATITTAPDEDWAFITGNTITDPIFRNGSVNINTTTEWSSLNISGSGSNTWLRVRNTANTAGGIILEGGTGGQRVFIHSTGIDNAQGENKLVYRIEDSTDVFTIDLSNGNTGIMTADPTQRLDVVGRARIRTLTGIQNEVLVTANNNGVLNSIDLTGSNQDVLLGNGSFGTPPSDGDWSGAGTGLMYTAYSADNVLIPSNFKVGGRVGINTDPSSSYRLKIAGSAFATGGFWPPSDVNYKTNIDNINNALNMIEQLQGIYFEWDTVNNPNLNFDTGRVIGLIAQDVEPIIPEIIKIDDSGIYSLNYDRLVPVLVEGIKELYAIVINLQDEIDTNSINARLDAIEDCINNLPPGLCGGSTKNYNNSDNNNILENNIDLVGAKLFQNQPNPFDVETEINYYLPENVTNAEMFIFDMQGKQIKRYELTTLEGNGKIIINGGELTPGMFFYSLIANGQEVGTKRMILTY